MDNIFECLIPHVKYVHNLGSSPRIIRNNFIISSDDNFVARIFNKRLKKLLGFDLKVIPGYKKSNIRFILENGYDIEEYKIIIDDVIAVYASTYNGLLYGAYTLLQIIEFSKNSLPKVEIVDSPQYAKRGIYYDVTRGKVPKLETLKELLETASFFKYNQLQLYIEHTFQFDDMEQVWYNKSPLTSEEILELDDYATKLGIDLIPSITTFGHMYEILRSQKYKEFCERIEPDLIPYDLFDRQIMHTINVFDENAIKLVYNMIDQYMPLFKSKYFNICADETFDLCVQKNKNKVNTHEDKYKIYCDYILKIVNYIKAKGKKVMMWDDILLSGDIKSMPEDIVYLDWDYSKEPDPLKRKKIAQMPNVSYCSGSCSWNNLVPDFDTMFANCDSMCSQGITNGVKGYYLTIWGDFGDIGSYTLLHPIIAYSGAISWEGSPRNDKDEFMRIASLLLQKDEELYSFAVLMSKYHIITWFELFFSLYPERIKERNLIDRFMQRQQQSESLDYAKLSIIEEMLYSKLVTAHDKDFVNEMINICEGIKAFNSFNLDTYQYTGSFDKLCRFWYNYCYYWRKYNKESELWRNTEIIDKLMLKFRTCGKEPKKG